MARQTAQASAPRAAPVRPPVPTRSNPVVSGARSLVDRVQRWKPVRVLRRYGDRRGPLLAAGLSFQAVFAVFAAVWVAFSVAGLVLGADRPLRDALIGILDTSVPGLIGPAGAIDPATLLSIPALGWTGAVALVGTLWTAIGWLGSARDAVRDLAGLAAPATGFALLKLKDLGLALAFGVALLVSALLSVFSTAAMDGTLDWLHADRHSLGAILTARIIGLALMFALDAGVLAALYRVLAGVPIPRGPLWQGALLGAAWLGVLKVLGSSLLGGATKNPLLASFAVIVGLLIWFNLVCQVILLAASWIVVTALDRGVPLDPVGERRARDAEVRLRAELERQIRREVEEALPPGVRWFVRRRHRREEEDAIAGSVAEGGMHASRPRRRSRRSAE